MSTNPAIKPNLAGFLLSRNVLYDNFGITVTFLIPIAPVYSSGTPLTSFGDPFDPWQQPASGYIEGTGWTSATVVGTLVTRPYGGRGQVRDQQMQTPLGIIPEQLVGLNIRPADFARVGPGGSLGQATEVAFFNERWEIREWRPDGLGGLERYVVYLTQAGAP